jgi:hypothetical protein
MKFLNQRPYSDPAVAARKLLEIANATEALRGRPHLHRDDQWPVLVQRGPGTPEEYSPDAPERWPSSRRMRDINPVRS